MSMKLWRPVGKAELDLIEAARWKAFPPRLPDQPIFYPVLTFGYAEKIARDWNSTRENHDYLGFVVEFEISEAMADKYPAEEAGGKAHTELWVPTEELEEFNSEIQGTIRLVATYKNGSKAD